MRYVDEVLQPGETILQVTTISRVGYVRGIAVLAAAFVAWGVTSTFTTSLISLSREIVTLALILAGLYFIGVTWWRRFTTEVAVIDRRVIYANGFINRLTVEMNMDQIESVDVEQPLVVRLLNYGDSLSMAPATAKRSFRRSIIRSISAAA
jgi:uncharacterized membrane protein YdbT with pleckstrin-like domain